MPTQNAITQQSSVKIIPADAKTAAEFVDWFASKLGNEVRTITALLGNHVHPLQDEQGQLFQKLKSTATHVEDVDAKLVALKQEIQNLESQLSSQPLSLSGTRLQSIRENQFSSLKKDFEERKQKKLDVLASKENLEKLHAETKRAVDAFKPAFLTYSGPSSTSITKAIECYTSFKATYTKSIEDSKLILTFHQSLSHALMRQLREYEDCEAKMIKMQKEIATSSPAAAAPGAVISAAPVVSKPADIVSQLKALTDGVNHLNRMLALPPATLPAPLEAEINTISLEFLSTSNKFHLVKKSMKESTVSKEQTAEFERCRDQLKAAQKAIQARRPQASSPAAASAAKLTTPLLPSASAKSPSPQLTEGATVAAQPSSPASPGSGKTPTTPTAAFFASCPPAATAAACAAASSVVTATRAASPQQQAGS